MPTVSVQRHPNRPSGRWVLAEAATVVACGLLYPAALRAQYVSPAPQVVAKAPGPVSTIFGIPVGGRLDADPLVLCANADAALAQRQCDDSDPARSAVAGERIGLTPTVLTARAWRLSSVKLNDQSAGTALLVGTLGRSLPLDVVIDRHDAVQFVSIPTPASEHDRLLAMLSAKYGKPMRTEATEWAGANGAEKTRSTPNYFWDFANVRIAYRSETTPATIAVPMATGHIRVALPSFADAMKPMPTPAPAATASASASSPR